MVNTKILFEAAKAAGVRRIVHVSITNPDIHSDLAYSRGKAALESALQALGVSYCILRPAVLFGREDVLINNTAWALRHLPIFGVFGSGDRDAQGGRADEISRAGGQQSGVGPMFYRIARPYF